VSRFGDRIIGVGGFINISQNARCVVFGGTLTAGDLDVSWEQGRTVIRKEGRHRKFVPRLEQICYSARMGRARGQVALFVTERAVFRVGADGLELIEIAPGVNLERDLLAKMSFRPEIAAALRVMDPAIFSRTPLGLAQRSPLPPEAPRSSTTSVDDLQADVVGEEASLVAAGFSTRSAPETA
jgi:propionate CoA-transferase